MAHHLSWPLVFTYAVFAGFAAQQRNAYQNFRGRSEFYYNCLGFYAMGTILFGLGFLVYCGFRLNWWSPIILVLGGLVGQIPFTWMEIKMQTVLPWMARILFGLLALPLCAVLLIRLVR